MDTISICGNLTRDPELRYTTSGKAVAGFGVAVNRRYQANDEWHETVTFHDVVAWGDLGEHAGQTLAQGHRVVIIGRIEGRSWVDKDTGETRHKNELVAADIGASLKWATATIEKATRTDAATGDEQEPSEEPF